MHKKFVLESRKLALDAAEEMRTLRVGENSNWFWQYIDTRITSFSTQYLCVLWLRKFVSKEVPSFIDVGSAPFLLPFIVNRSGLFSLVSAVDIDPSRFKNLDALDFEVLRADIEASPKFKCSYDIVYFSHIFEHLRRDLIGTVGVLHNLVNDGGVLYVETPNGLGLKAIRNFILRRSSLGCASNLFEEWSKLERFGHMGHVREYSKHELLHFFSRLGFEVVESGYSGLIDQVGFVKRLASYCQFIFPFLRNDVWLVLRKT